MKMIVLLSGKARSGKNTFADMLAEEFKNVNRIVTQDAFANGVKNGSKEDFKPLTDFLNDFAEKIKSQIGSLDGFNKNAPQSAFQQIDAMLNQIRTKDDNWYNEKTPVTRFLLQAYGTEIFRKRVDTDWWAKQLKNRFLVSNNDITLVTDARFPNEIEVFSDAQDYKVISIRVERNVNTNATIAAHDSETALDNWTAWDYIIDNNSSLESLKGSAIEVAKEILKGEEKYENDYMFGDVFALRKLYQC